MEKSVAMKKSERPLDAPLVTGSPALDFIMSGGFPPNHLYLIQGNPGSGKTTLGLQFLLEGLQHGETGLYVTLSETTEELVKLFPFQEIPLAKAN